MMEYICIVLRRPKIVHTNLDMKPLSNSSGSFKGFAPEFFTIILLYTH